MTLPADAPPVRPAHCCAVFDDHPRHVVVDPEHPGNELLFHMDCCAERRGCGICRAVLDGVDHRPGIVGDELRSRLEAQTPADVAHADGDPFGAVSVQSALI